MDVVGSKNKLEETRRGNEGIHSVVYEARSNVVYRSSEEQNFKQAVRVINPGLKWGLLKLLILGVKHN